MQEIRTKFYRETLCPTPLFGRGGVLALGLLGCASLVQGPALAQVTDDPAASDARSDSSEPLVVTGVRRGYGAKSSQGPTRTDTPIVDIPQSVSVVSRALIEDAAITSIAQLVRFSPGVTTGQGEGNRDQLTLRGNNTTSDFFVDGVRDDVQYFRSLYNIENVEILRGASALAFGRGGGGGVINRVTKAPVDTNFVQLRSFADRFASYGFELDANRALSSDDGIRLNAHYDRLDNHRDVFRGNSYGVNPTLAFSPGAHTRFLVSYEYAKDDRVADRGIPSFAGAPVSQARDRFFGVPGINFSAFAGHIGRIDFEQDLSENWLLRTNFVVANYDKIYSNLFPATSVTIDARTGRRQLGIEAYVDPTKRRNILSQTNVIGDVATGPIRHKLLFGFDAGNQRSNNSRQNGFFDASAVTSQNGRRTNVDFDRFVVPPVTFRAGPANRDFRSDADIFSVYGQDQIALTPHLEALIGARYDRFALAVDDRLARQSFFRADDLVSPRGALIYKPLSAGKADLSFYASFSRSFLPQSGDQFLNLDASRESLRPERFDNIEIGGKYAWDDRVSASLALYRLTRSNSRAPSGLAGIDVLTGQQRSRGLELSLNGQITANWQASLAYSWQRAQITRTTLAAPIGRQVGLVPHQIVNLWNRYDVNRLLGLGLGVYYQGDSFTTISNNVRLPDFVRLDGAIFLHLNNRWQAQINVENLNNAYYFPTAHTDNNISTGVPRNVRLTLQTKF